MSAGVLSQISFAPESSWGSAATPNKSIAVQPGEGIQTDPDIQFVKGIKAQLAENISAFHGNAKHEGPYEFDFIPGYAGYFLKSVFGIVSSVQKGGDATVYDHTFSEAESKPSLTIEQSTGDITRRYAGSIVHALKLSCKTGDVLRASIGVKAKSQASATKITPAYETIRPFNFGDLGANGISIGGSAFDEVKSFELEYKNNAEMVHTTVGQNPTFNFVKPSTVEGKFEFYLNTDTAAMYTDYLAGTTRALIFTFTGDAIGSSSNYKLVINVPVAKYTTSTYPITDDHCKLTVNWKGIHDTATSRLLNMILTNLSANYN